MESPVVHDRMHWTLAEAINTSSVLWHVTGEEEYAEDYSMFLQYLDEIVWDHKTGSWFHQLDRDNKLLDTVSAGEIRSLPCGAGNTDPFIPAEAFDRSGCKEA